jgi:hypothetical protein
MWTTLALLAALGAAPSQSAELSLKNVRATYGFLGAERHDDKVLPGDAYFLEFDIEGIQVDDDGKVQYSMAMEVTDSKNKVIYARDPSEMVAYNALGGNRVQGITYVDVGFDQPPGECTVKVTVVDLKSKAKQSFQRKFEVLPKSFGLARLMTSYDPGGRLPAPPGGVVGQILFLNFAVIGFDRDPAKKQPDVRLQMRILDESGQPTLRKPFTGDTAQSDVSEGSIAVPMNFTVPLNRSGKFTIELQATDRVSKKTSKLAIPLVVVERKSEQK